MIRTNEVLEQTASNEHWDGYKETKVASEDRDWEGSS